MPYVAEWDQQKCLECGACEELIACPGAPECIGCGSCALACPNQAIQMVERERGKEIAVEVDGKGFYVPEQITVKQALIELGYKLTKLPGEQGLFVPCEVGGCWSCAMEIDGEVKPSCITPVKEGTSIKTELLKDYLPKRLVHGFMGHQVGGVGTPWYLKGRAFIEVACFAAGCNFRCPQCQNWTTTYRSKGHPLTPEEAAQIMTRTRRRFDVHRMAISGGECTLNRRWLVQYIKELKQLNPDREARFHVDTNGSLLSGDYIGELVEAGITDIGIDLKSLETETFMRITGLTERGLAERYKQTAWQAVEYISNNYPQVFLGIGIPFNKELISIEEVQRLGEKICHIDPSMQVCVLDYRPEFRRKHLTRPSYEEMLQVHRALRDVGLKTVICQVPRGHIGPKGFLP